MCSMDLGECVTLRPSIICESILSFLYKETQNSVKLLP